MGQSTLIGLNKSFLDATNNGASLGVTLDEATEFFLTDQQFRARTLNKDRIDQRRYRFSLILLFTYQGEKKDF